MNLNQRKPYISIVIPAFNEARYIRRTLISLAAQECNVPFEVIVVDNNSTDRTGEIARELGAKVLVEKKAGVCAARQAGTLAARGEIVVSTDADTTFKHNWLQNIVDTFELYPEAPAVSGGVIFVGAPWWGHLYTRLVFGINKWTFNNLQTLYYVSACNLAFRKAYFEGYNTNLTQGGDELDLLRRFKKHGSVAYLAGNETLTSSRRLKKGLFYSIFVTSLVYYVLDYNIGRLTGKSLFGSYAAIRDEHPWVDRWKVRLAPILVGLTLALMSMMLFSHRAVAVRAIHGTGRALHRIRGEM